VRFDRHGVGAQFGVRSLFFTYFAIVGAFAPYLSLYFAAVGMSIAQIGVLMALPQMMRIFGPPFWGALADRLGHRALLLRVSALAGLLGVSLLGVAGDSYIGLIAVLAFYYFASSAQAPLAETMALAAAGGDSGRYGRMRLWGSIGFIAAVALTGPTLDALGVTRLTWVMSLLWVLLLIVTWRVPEPETRPADRGPPVWARLREPAIAAFFGSCFLMLFAHAALYAFYSLYLERAGYSKTLIGLAWTLGVLAEIVLFRVQRPLFERFGALTLVGASLAVAALRFALVALAGTQPLVVVVTQLMHAITFGLHHSAVMALLHRWFGEREQGRAQAMYVTLGYGLGGASGGIVAGWLWAGIGPQAAFWGASVAAVLGWAAVALAGRFDYAPRKG
jgi:PPP family 3-phenylpropionic acid transporter